MGIKHLNRFLRDTCKEGIECIDLDSISGKTIVVDASIYLYRYSVSNDLMKRMESMLTMFRFYAIRPIFVFDGKPPTEKKALLEERYQDRVKAELEIRKTEILLRTARSWKEKNEIEGKLALLKKSCVVITRETIAQVKNLMDVYEAKHIHAEGEADEVCAQMVLKGEAWACLSEDMDMFVYGCPRVLRYFSLLKHNVVCYHMDEILRQLKMTQNEFREVCVLSGTDYNRKQEKREICKSMAYFRQYKASPAYSHTGFYDWLVTHSSAYIGDLAHLLQIRELFQLF